MKSVQNNNDQKQYLLCKEVGDYRGEGNLTENNQPTGKILSGKNIDNVEEKVFYLGSQSWSSSGGRDVWEGFHFEEGDGVPPPPGGSRWGGGCGQPLPDVGRGGPTPPPLLLHCTVHSRLQKESHFPSDSSQLFVVLHSLFPILTYFWWPFRFSLFCRCFSHFHCFCLFQSGFFLNIKMLLCCFIEKYWVSPWGGSVKGCLKK